MKLNFNDLFERTLTWEKAVVVLSAMFGAAMFIAIYVVGNVGHQMGKFPQVDLKTGGLWFLRGLASLFVLGTAINAASLLIAIARRLIRGT